MSKYGPEKGHLTQWIIQWCLLIILSLIFTTVWSPHHTDGNIRHYHKNSNLVFPATAQFKEYPTKNVDSNYIKTYLLKLCVAN